MKPCPICGGRLVEQDDEYSECEVCKSQMWKSDEVIEQERRAKMVRTKRNEFFLGIDYPSRPQPLPWGPPKPGIGSRSGKKYSDGKKEKLKRPKVFGYYEG